MSGATMFRKETRRDFALIRGGLPDVATPHLTWWADGAGGVPELGAAVLSDLPDDFDPWSFRPARHFPSWRAQRNFPGMWWSSTTSGFVGFESWLERDCLIRFDHDPTIDRIVSQPFWFHGMSNGRRWSKAPDYLIRRTDGTVEVVEVRPKDKSHQQRYRHALELEAEAAAALGWVLTERHEPTPQIMRNVNWLAAYRRPLLAPSSIVEGVRRACIEPIAFGDLVDQLAAQTNEPAAFLKPVVFQECWFGRITIDPRRRWTDATPVTAGPGSEVEW